jgi:CheY-like chemotaxis protein
MNRILVVDDVSEELQIIHEALSIPGGFEIHGVNHGDAAFDHLATSPRLPDLILLDVHMPGMSGLEVLAGIKMDSRWGDIPVILMTAGAGNDEEQGLELGASDWIQKPIQAGALVVRIHNQLNIHKQKARAQTLSRQTATAATQALQEIAANVRSNIDSIQGHWDRFYKVFGADEDVCPTQMHEEMPVLIHELRADVTRMLRLAEGIG